jgi:Tfp pilus assembly protein PilO
MKGLKQWKTVVRVGLVVLLVADVLLVVFIAHISANTPESKRQEREHLQVEARLLAADVARAQAIKADLSQVSTKSDEFLTRKLPESAAGYSTLEADLGEIAGRAGLKTSLIGFRQKEVKDRGVTEVTITASVDGDYPSLIKFLSGLEHSGNFYILDNLTLASEATGSSIKLSLSLRSYFRT